jgi:hypothetical protein
MANDERKSGYERIKERRQIQIIVSGMQTVVACENAKRIDSILQRAEDAVIRGSLPAARVSGVIKELDDLNRLVASKITEIQRKVRNSNRRNRPQGRKKPASQQPAHPSEQPKVVKKKAVKKKTVKKKAVKKAVKE